MTNSLEQMIQPFEIGTEERVQDVFVKQFSDVVDSLSKENRHTDFDRPVFLFFVWEITWGSVCQELETALVEVLVILLSAVVQSKDLGKESEHLRIIFSDEFKSLLNLVENLKAVMVMTQA